MSFLQLVLNGLAFGADCFGLVGIRLHRQCDRRRQFCARRPRYGWRLCGHSRRLALSGAVLLLLPVVALVTFVLGIVVSLIAYFPLIRRPPATVFISTLLCGMILQNTFLVVFGPEARSGPGFDRHRHAAFRRLGA